MHIYVVGLLGMVIAAPLGFLLVITAPVDNRSPAQRRAARECYRRSGVMP